MGRGPNEAGGRRGVVKRNPRPVPRVTRVGLLSRRGANPSDSLALRHVNPRINTCYITRVTATRSAHSSFDMTRSNTGATLAALLLATVVATALCAPSSGGAGTTTEEELPQWHHPCGMMAKSAHAQRHVRTGGQKEVKDLLRLVKKQFQLAQSMFEKLSPDITELYGNVPSFEELSIPWLEFKHFDWYKKNVRNLHIKEKARSVLQHMHVSMQTMLATIHSMQQLKSFGKHLEPRKGLFIAVRNEVNKGSNKCSLYREQPTAACMPVCIVAQEGSLKDSHLVVNALYESMRDGEWWCVVQMLCESEDALLRLNATLPERVSIDVVAWDAATNDDTQLLIKDSVVLDKLQRSVKNWLRVLDDMLSARPKHKPRGNRNKNNGKGSKVDKGRQQSRTRTTRKPRRRQLAQR
ncbi:hypothetical protein PR048_000903 [Dryococelus australis]|uniref:Uncharacterized protein n=1 Tax=Dryococelus australis TaxID=614101 RepID=A0ABQ9IGH5_9NEOP|nr:hypothetical protein PR048_000903 [Dryococelus australis]